MKKYLSLLFMFAIPVIILMADSHRSSMHSNVTIPSLKAADCETEKNEMDAAFEEYKKAQEAESKANGARQQAENKATMAKKEAKADQDLWNENHFPEDCNVPDKSDCEKIREIKNKSKAAADKAEKEAKEARDNAKKASNETANKKTKWKNKVKIYNKCTSTSQLVPSVNARCDGGHMQLQWSVDSAIASRSFSIEKSEDGQNWIPVGTIPVPGNHPNNFVYTDATSDVHSNFYRVITYREQASKMYSSIIASTCPSVQQLTALPNPSQNNIVVNLPSLKQTTSLLSVFDSRGNLVQTRQVNLHKGSNQFHVNLSKLKPGPYILTVNSGETQRSIRIIKN